MLRNALFNASGAVAAMAISVLTIPVLIRLIGIEQYGLWTLVTATVGLVGLAEAGLPVSTTVLLSRDLATDDNDGISQTLTMALGCMLLIGTTVALVLWWSASGLAGLFTTLDDTQRATVARSLRLGGLFIAAKLLQQITIAVGQAHRRYGVLNSLATAQAALLSLGSIVVAWRGGTVVSIMGWYTAVSLGCLVAFAAFAWRLVAHRQPRVAFEAAKGKALATTSMMTWGVSLSGALFSQMDRIVVGATLGPTSLGVYGALTSVTSKINYLSAAPIQPLLPELSGLLAAGHRGQAAVAHRVRQAETLNVLVALGLGLVLLAFGPLVVQILIPGKMATEYLMAFQLAVIIYALYSPNAAGYYILLADSPGTCLAVQTASALSSLALIFIGARDFGLLGAVAGNAAYLGIWLLTFLGMRRLGVPPRQWTPWVAAPLLWSSLIAAMTLLLSASGVGAMALLATAGVGPLLAWWWRGQVFTDWPGRHRV